MKSVSETQTKKDSVTKEEVQEIQDDIITSQILEETTIPELRASNNETSHMGTKKYPTYNSIKFSDYEIVIRNKNKEVESGVWEVTDEILAFIQTIAGKYKKQYLRAITLLEMQNFFNENSKNILQIAKQDRKYENELKRKNKQTSS